MILEFLPNALNAYKSLKVNDPVFAAKIKAIIKDSIEHPITGAGAPVQLSGAYEGIWMRRLSVTDEMYYAFDESKLIILAFSFTEIQANAAHSGVSLQAFTDEEYASVMSQMASNRGRDSEPKVG